MARIVPITSGSGTFHFGAGSPAARQAIIRGEVLALDINMLSLCAAFQKLEREKRALFDPIRDDCARAGRYMGFDALQEPLVHRIAGTRAETFIQHQARARVLKAFAGDLFQDQAASPFWDERLKAAIVRDLAE